MTSKAQKVIRRTSIVFALLPLTPVFVWLAVVAVIPALHDFVGFFAVFGYLLCWPVAIALGLVDLGMTISKRIASKQKSTADSL
jgi:hypothetical protein